MNNRKIFPHNALSKSIHKFPLFPALHFTIQYIKIQKKFIQLFPRDSPVVWIFFIRKTCTFSRAIHDITGIGNTSAQAIISVIDIDITLLQTTTYHPELDCIPVIMKVPEDTVLTPLFQIRRTRAGDV